MAIHYSDLHILYPETPKALLEATVDPLNAVCERFDITTGTRIAAFVAQIGHESLGFNRLVENLNYSAQGLQSTFSRYFPTWELAKGYEHKPNRIAARVYANRMGNGSESSQDGWTYRGRGFIQITGKANYEAFALYMEMNVRDTISYLETRHGAAMSAGWYWASKSLNALADMGKFSDITYRINGGQNGWQDRERHYVLAKRVFA